MPGGRHAGSPAAECCPSSDGRLQSWHASERTAAMGSCRRESLCLQKWYKTFQVPPAPASSPSATRAALKVDLPCPEPPIRANRGGRCEGSTAAARICSVALGASRHTMPCRHWHAVLSLALDLKLTPHQSSDRSIVQDHFNSKQRRLTSGDASDSSQS